jgi:hypothetical protein
MLPMLMILPTLRSAMLLAASFDLISLRNPVFAHLDDTGTCNNACSAQDIWG